MNISGISIGGISTSIVLKNQDMVFDIGGAFPSENCSINNLFISHPHGDHISGIFCYLGIRDLQGIKNTLKIYILEEYSEELRNSLNSFRKLSFGEWIYEIIPINIFDKILLKNNYIVKVQRNHHRIPSCAFTVFEKRKKLKSELEGKSAEEIIKIKSTGFNISDEILYNVLSFSGDTTKNFWELSPEVLESRILINECTYYKEEENKGFSRGHTDDKDFLNNIDLFKNEFILLSHYSGKYNKKEVKNIIKENFPIKFSLFEGNLIDI